jgi:U6 snRNA-associated Sm-like protein LSm6
MTEQENGESQSGSPQAFLNSVVGEPVWVRLNSGIDYKGYSKHLSTLILTLGTLTCLDGYMNVALEQTEEYVNGQFKRKYGDCFVRGNNVLYIRRLK